METMKKYDSYTAIRQPAHGIEWQRGTSLPCMEIASYMPFTAISVYTNFIVRIWNGIYI